MVKLHLSGEETPSSQVTIKVVRHAQVCEKLQISSAKLFDMCAKGLFPKPFQLIPGGRAVGWIELDVDRWVISRKEASTQEAV